MIQVSTTYAAEANHYLAEALLAAIDAENWDAVEAISWALHEYAQTFTKPKGPNA